MEDMPAPAPAPPPPPPPQLVDVSSSAAAGMSTLTPDEVKRELARLTELAGVELNTHSVHVLYPAAPRE